MTQPKPKTHAKRTGQPRGAFPVMQTMEMAAVAIGVPISLVKAAKRAGCKAFLVSGRTDTAILIPYLFQMLHKGSDLPDGFASWREMLEAEKAKREGIKRQQDEKSVMLTADAQRQAGEAMVMVFAELERRDRELPPALAGLPAVEIFKRMNADTEAIRRNLKTKFEEVGK